MIRTAVLAEWTKIRTVRSTWWSLGVATAACVGLSVYFGQMMSGRFDSLDAERRAAWDPTQYGFFPLTLGLIALVVFGVLQTSAEFTTGTIRPSLVAVPRRGLFLGAKAFAAIAVAGVVSVVIGFGAFLGAQSALGEHGASLGEPGVLRAVLGACAYLTLMCGLAMGIATMLRSTAGSLGILIPILFLNSQGASNVPAIRPVTQYLPDQAGFAMMRVTPLEEGGLGYTDYGPAVGFVILLAWTVAALLGGYLALRRRDA